MNDHEVMKYQGVDGTTFEADAENPRSELLLGGRTDDVEVLYPVVCVAKKSEGFDWSARR